MWLRFIYFFTWLIFIFYKHVSLTFISIKSYVYKELFTLKFVSEKLELARAT